MLALATVVRWSQGRGLAVRHARATRGEAFAHGVVEAPEPPVTVEIDQKHRKNGTWEQAAAHAHLASFGLRRSNDTTVRVEPDDNVALLWSPDLALLGVPDAPTRAVVGVAV